VGVICDAREYALESLGYRTHQGAGCKEVLEDVI